MTCPHEDNVVARFLDGDVTAAPALDLEAHLGSCASCRRALTRSRHLDAMVAATASGLGDAATADRLLARAMAQAATPAPRLVVPGRHARIAWSAAAGFVLGLLAMYELGRPMVRGRELPAPSEQQATLPVRPDPDMLLLPDPQDSNARTPAPLPEAPRATMGLLGGLLGGLPAARPELHRCAALLEDADLVRALDLQARARALACGWPHFRQAMIQASATATQIAAGRALLDNAAAAAVLAVARRTDLDDDVARALLSSAAAHRGFQKRLRTALHDTCDVSLCRLAVRLGGAELDRRVIARVRREASIADQVAAACTTAADGVTRVGFLLELWAEITRNGDDAMPADDLARAPAWFAALPSHATALLLQQLQSTRSAEVREQVFLALAARADLAALEPLLAFIEAPNVSVATLAAYALGCYPASTAPRLEAAARSSRRPEFLWAAIASQGALSMQSSLLGRLLAAGLPADEVALVATGRFRPPQIAAVASLLRGRNLLPVSKP